MILHASRNSKESCKDDGNKRSGMELHHEQEMAVAIAASMGIKQFYRGKVIDWGSALTSGFPQKQCPTARYAHSLSRDSL
eukprot:scaffold29803_cov71-Attheya_sp.AAC.1